MTEKRFIKPYKDCRVIKNTQTDEIATYYDTEDGLIFLKWLNDLSDENEQLKKVTGLLKNDNVNDIVDVLNLQQTTIWELKRENEKLKHFIQELITKGTGKIHLANGYVYNINAILNDFKGDEQ